MRMPWSKSKLPGGLGLWVLAGWLIATGVLHLLNIGNPTASTILAIAAIAAGVLLLLGR